MKSAPRPHAVPLSDLLEPVPCIEAVKAGERLKLVVPGVTGWHAGRLVTEVVAAAHVAVTGGRKGHAGTVLLRLAADPCDLAASDAEFPAEALSGQAIGGFALKVESARVDGGDLLELAASGRADASSPLAVTLQQVVVLEGRRKPWQSAPISGLAALSLASDPYPGGEPDDALPFLFDCHSHWYSQRRTGRPTRYWTVCHGPCPATSCHCASSGSTRYRACAGWKLCAC